MQIQENSRFQVIDRFYANDKQYMYFRINYIPRSNIEEIERERERNHC